MRGNPNEVAFCYLYEDFPRMVPYTRLNNERVEITLPLPTGDCVFGLLHDHRSQQAIVIFDGDIPWCGLPRAGVQKLQHIVCDVKASAGQQRKRRGCELRAPSDMPLYSGETLVINRRFLVLPAGNALVMRYRQHSLVAWYCMISVRRHSENLTNVDFVNSDY